MRAAFQWAVWAGTVAIAAAAGAAWTPITSTSGAGAPPAGGGSSAEVMCDLLGSVADPVARAAACDAMHGAALEDLRRLCPAICEEAWPTAPERRPRATPPSLGSGLSGMGGLLDLTNGKPLAELLPMDELRPKAEAEVAAARRRRRLAEGAGSDHGGTGSDGQTCFNFAELSFMPPYVRPSRSPI